MPKYTQWKMGTQKLRIVVVTGSIASARTSHLGKISTEACAWPSLTLGLMDWTGYVKHTHLCLLTSESFRRHRPLTTTLTCLDRSLELLCRKSEKAAWGDRDMHTVISFLSHSFLLLCLCTLSLSSGTQSCAHPCIEHLVAEATVEFLRVGLCRRETECWAGEQL